MTTENSNRKSNLVITVAILLLAGSLIYLTIEMGNNNRLEKNLKNELLNSESLLSEKLLLQKDILKLKTELNPLLSKNNDLNKELNAISKRLENSEKELKKLQKQSASISQLKKQNKELSKLKETLEQQLDYYKTSLKQLQSSNDDLERTVSVLQQQNKELNEALEVAKLSAMNEILIESTKKNGKLTVKAKRIKKLIVNVDVSAKAENLSFKIIDPNGKELTDKEGTLAINTISEGKQKPQAFYVANSSLSQPVYNTIQMIYSPSAKLFSGTYKIEIRSNSKSIGSLRVKLK